VSPLQKRIVEVAISWLKTPFYPHGAVKGVAADCVSFALAVYVEVGLIPVGTKLPDYRLTDGDHNSTSQVLTWLQGAGWFSVAETKQPGDLITLQFGRVAHHVGIVISDTEFIQSIRGYGVIRSDLRDATWATRIRTTWRPV
jgi:cell wall-associated NlpC family hydrolase